MGNEPEKLNFNVGDEVFYFTHSYSSIGFEKAKLTTVEKVHKTTRFTLRGSSRQFNQHGSQAGDHYVYAHVEQATSELRLKVKSAKATFALRKKALNVLQEATESIKRMKTVEEIDAYMSRIWEAE